LAPKALHAAGPSGIAPTLAPAKVACGAAATAAFEFVLAAVVSLPAPNQNAETTKLKIAAQEYIARVDFDTLVQIIKNSLLKDFLLTDKDVNKITPVL
jgi:hypothetical protein